MLDIMVLFFNVFLYSARCFPYIGFTPAILIRDPKLIKDILVKDFKYFRNRGYNYDTNYNKLAANLFASDKNWKEMRAKL